ncbi:MAG: DUF3179 domain-containing protein [Carboxylicivirga sp.]|jgi:hypothetical protein|nr:DUF3179 domain-containing protein [Carboxylicivirga sp.]
MMGFIKLTALFVLMSACSKSDSDKGLPSAGLPKNKTDKVVVIEDTFNGIDIVLAGNVADLYIVSFERQINGSNLSFSPLQDELPNIMEDNEGNTWDIFGYATTGPREGQRLKPTQSLMGYWFSFGTFFPGIEIFPLADKGEFDGKKIEGSGTWLIPQNEVRAGGVGRDGIPAISNPRFDVGSSVSFLADNDLVIGYKNGNSTKAYPHDVLDWHEIVNDQLSGTDYAIIYCPLTGTATAWDRNINGTMSTFGVSGLLYNSNIIPYDRTSNSNWSQLFDKAVSGLYIGHKPRNFMLLETKWSTWRKIYPKSEVMNFNTGHSRNYGTYPYDNYKNDKSLIFPIKYHDIRLHEKERVHAVIVNGKARAYRFQSFVSE